MTASSTPSAKLPIKKIKSPDELRAAYPGRTFNAVPEFGGAMTEENFWRFREYVRFIRIVFTDPSVPETCYKKPQFGIHFTDKKELAWEHCLHMSLENPEMICYTPNPEYGKADRQVQVKPGKYLKEFYGDRYTDEQIAEMANYYRTINTPPTLEIATDPDEIVSVYVSGPASCMSHPAGSTKYDQIIRAAEIHPASAYGAPGNAGLAYFKRGTNIAARGIVNLDTKQWVRLYGDAATLGRLLLAAGFKQGSLEGLRLRRIEAKEGFAIVLPYLDGPQHFELHDDHVLVTAKGPLGNQGPAGTYWYKKPWRCWACETLFESEDQADAVGVWDGDPVCSPCVENGTVVEAIVDTYGELGYVHIDNVIEIEGRDLYVRNRLSRWTLDNERWVMARDEDNERVPALENECVRSNLHGVWIPQDIAIEFVGTYGDRDFTYASRIDEYWQVTERGIRPNDGSDDSPYPRINHVQFLRENFGVQINMDRLPPAHRQILAGMGV